MVFRRAFLDCFYVASLAGFGVLAGVPRGKRSRRVSPPFSYRCYGTALIFHFFSLFGLVDIIIRFKGEHMVNTCCSTTHGC